MNAHKNIESQKKKREKYERPTISVNHLESEHTLLEKSWGIDGEDENTKDYVQVEESTQENDNLIDSNWGWD